MTCYRNSCYSGIHFRSCIHCTCVPFTTIHRMASIFSWTVLYLSVVSVGEDGFRVRVKGSSDTTLEEVLLITAWCQPPGKVRVRGGCPRQTGRDKGD